MKTRRAEHAGFVLVFVVMIMGLIAVEMFVLTDISNTISFEANTAYLEACRDNLTLSGLAWSQSNPGRFGSEEIELDVGALAIRDGLLNLKLTAADGDQEYLSISASCSRGRRTLRHRAKYPRD